MIPCPFLTYRTFYRRVMWKLFDICLLFVCHMPLIYQKLECNRKSLFKSEVTPDMNQWWRIFEIKRSKVKVIGNENVNCTCFIAYLYDVNRFTSRGAWCRHSKAIIFQKYTLVSLGQYIFYHWIWLQMVRIVRDYCIWTMVPLGP